MSIEAYNREEMLTLAKADLDVLAGLALPEVFTLLFPPVFKAIWQLLVDSAEKTEDTKLDIGLPRGFAKTTVVKLYILYLVLFSDKRYILITAANAPKASHILADVKLLLTAPNIKALFGNILIDAESNNTTLLSFTFNGRRINIQSLGAGQDPRGANLSFNRPDVIISDDIQGRADAFSPVLSESLSDWYHASLMLAKSEKGCLFIYIGNMYPTKGCLLAKFRDSPDWISFIAGAILEDGKSIWEEFKSTKAIMRDLDEAVRNNTTHIFFSEILNDSKVSGNVIFDTTKLLIGKPTEAQGSFIVIDPSGSKPTSNDTAIGLCKVHDGIPYLAELERGIYTPIETITRALDMASRHNVGVVIIENYAYQASLLTWFEYVCRMNGIFGIQCLPINRGTATKNGAITNMFGQLQAREIGLYPELVGEVLSDIVRFNPMTQNNRDDLLDILVYLPLCTIKYQNEIRQIIQASYEDLTQLGVVENNCDF